MAEFNPIQAFLGGSDGTSEEGDNLPSEVKNSINKNFKKTQNQLQSYGLLGEGHKYKFEMNTGNRDAVATNRSNFIPFMISIAPPIEFPSGNFKERQIPAPQEISTKLTSIGDEGDVIAVRDRSEEEGPSPTFQGAVDRAATAGETLEEDDEEEEAVGLEAGLPDPTITTEVSVSNLEANSQAEAAFDEYLANLRERYKSFEKSSFEAERQTEEENTPQVEGREFAEDTFAQRIKRLQTARSFETTEEYLRTQALLMRDLEPLLMYINPTSFSVSYDHVISDGTKTREGHIVEHWGLDQPTIDASGTVGAFYVDQDGEGGGLTEAHRRDSAAFQSFMNLFMAYRNNAYIYNPDDRISIMGTVRLFYDGTIYVGSFDEFSITESAEQPHTLEYNFSFTVDFEQDINPTSNSSSSSDSDFSIPGVGNQDELVF